MVSKRNIIDVTILIPANAFFSNECSFLSTGFVGVDVLFAVDVSVVNDVVEELTFTVIGFTDLLVVKDTEFLVVLVIGFEEYEVRGPVLGGFVPKDVSLPLLPGGILSVDE